MLRFTEPLVLELSRIEIIDPAGRDVGVGPTRVVPGDPRAMQRKVGLLPPGAYTVRWATASTLDGHTLRGSYGFGIGTAAGDERVQNSPVSSEGWLGLLGRFTALVGLALWFGSSALRNVASRAGVPAGRIRLLRRFAPVLALAGTAVSLASSAQVSAGSLSGLGALISFSWSGRVRAGLAALAGAGVLAGSRLPKLAAPLAGLAVLVEAASGHAAVAPIPPLAVGVAALHLGAAGVWVFAIAASSLAGKGTLHALATFSPYAVGAAGVAGLTGLANAGLELGRPGDLVSTAYGKTLIAKGLAFAAMGLLGFTHNRWRRRPEPSGSGVKAPLRLEAGAAALALMLATALVGFPTPPRQRGEEVGAANVDPSLARLAEREALSTAEASGSFVVGLTLLPPATGEVEFRLQVVGAEAGDGLRAARVRASSEVSSAEAALRPCDAPVLGCFAGRGRIPAAGVWAVEVPISSNRGPITTRTLLPLPASDGSMELERALAAMERLQSARMLETLAAAVGAAPIVSRYEFRAPDAFALSLRDSQQVVIGTRAYRKEGAGGWVSRQWPDPGFSWPARYYSEYWVRPAAVRLLGVEEVDGVGSNVVAFVRPDVPAWFRVFVGAADGLVRRMEMRAQGHLMTDVYRDFNAPLTIEPPG